MECQSPKEEEGEPSEFDARETVHGAMHRGVVVELAEKMEEKRLTNPTDTVGDGNDEKPAIKHVNVAKTQVFLYVLVIILDSSDHLPVIFGS